MRDLHMVVVDDIGEVVCRGAVAFEKDWVFIAARGLRDGVVAEFYGAVDKILEGGVGGGCFKADDMRRACRELRINLRLCQVRARAVVVGGEILFLASNRQGSETGWWAEAAVGVGVVEKALGVRLVEGGALGLFVGGVRAGDEWAFVPLQARPTEGFVEGVFGARDGAFGVGVFDAEEELTAGGFSEEVVEEGGAEGAEVEEARGGGGEASAGRFMGGEGGGGDCCRRSGGGTTSPEVKGGQLCLVVEF